MEDHHDVYNTGSSDGDEPKDRQKQKHVATMAKRNRKQRYQEWLVV